MLTVLVVAPLLVSVILFLFSFSRFGAVVAILSQVALFVLSVYFFLQARLEPIVDIVGGYPSVLGIILRMDAVSGALVVMATAAFLVISVYACKEKLSRMFWLCLYIWQTMIIGLFLTRDLFNAFVLIEVSTIVIIIMIMYNRYSRCLYDGIIYLMTGMIGMMFYLFGLGYLYMMTGALDMDAMAAAMVYLEPEQLVLPYVLMMTGLGFKAALMPVFSWLPKVRPIPRSPSPVAAILSGIHVKTLVFLIIQINDMFPMIDSSVMFIVLGVMTAIGAVFMALSQNDIKLILAYSSIAQVGLIIVGLQLDGEYARMGSIYHMINHALFKTVLFLSSGMIIEMYNTRDIRKIRGLWRGSKVLSIIVALGIGGIIGAPFFNGSVSKYFIMADLGMHEPMFWVLSLINLGTVTVFMRYAVMFLGTPAADIKRRVCGFKVVSVGSLGLLCLGMGVGLGAVATWLFNSSMTVAMGGYIEKVAIFAISVVAALAIYRYVISESAAIRRLADIDINFRGLAASVGGFFVVVMLFIGILA